MISVFFVGAIVAVCAFIITCNYYRKLSERDSNTMNKLNKTMDSFTFMILSYFFLFAHVVLIYYIESHVWGLMVPLVSALALCFIWWIMEKSYEISVNCGRYKSQMNFKKKNSCYIISLIGLLFTGIVFYLMKKDSEYLKLAVIAASITIGAYIPVSAIYKNSLVTDIWDEVKSQFESFFRKDLVANMIFTIIITIISILAVFYKHFELFFRGFSIGILTISIVYVAELCIKNSLRDKS